MEKAKATNNIALFQGKKIRKTIYQEEWWFVIADIINALVDSNDIKQYINKMRKRDPELSKGWVQIVHPLPIKTEGGMQNLNCSNTEGILRIIQSIPSPKAEPLKRWLAKVGYERIQEIDNPELATKRTRLLYKLKGYSEDWIEKRMRGIAIREELTEEWQKCGAKKDKDYEILTAEISQATFGLKPSEHKEVKGLKFENLRDHMDDFELILTMLSEKTTSEIHRTNDSSGMVKLKDDARVGGSIVGATRKQIERKIGRPIVSDKNFLKNNEKKLKNRDRLEA
ncbi:MAG: Bro-N domain-containing protein [Candidatus Pacebacteria bacterium]|nr:Bro-N domain-containing protein [Candidatus Paceibacterota bacterium]